MLFWARIFLIVTGLAGLFAFVDTGQATAASAQTLFFVFAGLFCLAVAVAAVLPSDRE